VLNRTGGLSSAGQLALLQAIAQSGSNLPRPQIAIVNAYQLLENRRTAGGGTIVADSSKHRYDIWREDGDIVYVPTTDIARRADYIDLVWTRGIRAVEGFSSSAGYSADDAVDWLGPNP